MRPKTFTSCVLSEKSTKGMHKLRATLENSIAMHKLCAEWKIKKKDMHKLCATLMLQTRTSCVQSEN